MDHEAAKDILKGKLSDYLEATGRPIKEPRGGACPFGCGTGYKTPNAHLYLNGQRVHCFACGENHDLFGLVGYDNNLPDTDETFSKRLSIAAGFFNISLDEDLSLSEPRNIRTPFYKPAPKEQPETPNADYSNYYKKCQENKEPAYSYLMSRGISREVLDRHQVGYDPELLCMALSKPKEGKYTKVPAAIIPVTNSYYNARNIDHKAPKEGRHIKPSNNKGARSAPAGLEYLNQKEPVFVVESSIDQMSIETAGGLAIAMGGAASSSQLVDAVKERLKEKSSCPILLIALDQDIAGARGTIKLCEALKNSGATFKKVNISGQYKDANERLQQDPTGLAQAIQEIIKESMSVSANAEQQEDKELNEYRDLNSTASYMERFHLIVEEAAKRPPIPTGFKYLDIRLDGGLFDGLYVIGAISSLGKTTFILQAADNMAAKGYDVLFFSLEMNRLELAGKSISRQTFLLDNTAGRKLAKTTRQITNGANYCNYSEEETALIDEAVDSYHEMAGNIYIIEGNGDIGPKELDEAVDKHKRLTGKVPVVMVDYLQILKPTEPRASDKQNVDIAVSELKRISRRFKTPVIAVSSLNRENYHAPISQSSFKESGAVEYSSDVLIGLQVAGADEYSESTKSKNHKDTEEKKRQDPREIELKILKNRNGKTGDKLQYRFYAAYNYFAEEQPNYKGGWT